MAGEEKFPIVVEIAPRVEQGERAVVQSLDKMEKKGEEVSRELAAAVERIPHAVAGAVREAASEVDRLRAAEEKAARAAQQAAQEEKEWASALAKAEHDHAQAIRDTTAAAEKSLAMARENKSAWGEAIGGMRGGWKDITRTIGDVGNAIGAVRNAIDLVTVGFNTSKLAAKAAIEVWRSMDNSGPGAYSGVDTRVARREYDIANHPERYNLPAGYGVSSLPANLRAMLRDEREDDLFEKAVKDWAASLYAARKAITDKFKADNDAIAARTQAYLEDLKTSDPAAYRRAMGLDPPTPPAPPPKAPTAGGARGPRGVPATADGAWFDGARRAVVAYIEQLAQAKADQDALAASAVEFADQMTMAWYSVSGAVEDFSAGASGKRGPRRDAAGFAVGKGGSAYGVELKDAKQDAIDFAAALQGPVGSAIDGLIDGMVRWDMSWKDWGRSALEMITKVMIQLLALQAIQGVFGAGGGGSTLGRVLWGAFGGGPAGGGSSKREVPGDPFGGAAQTSGAVWRAPVMPSSPAGGGGAAPVFNLKVVNVSDPRAAALEMINSPEGTRAILNTVSGNSQKLGIR